MRRLSILLLALLTVSNAYAQDLTEADYARAERFMGQTLSRLVYRASVQPNWLEGDRFWYRSTTGEGTAEFVLVDPSKKRRAPAFDHAKLAAGITAATGTAHTANELPFMSFSYSQDERSITFDIERDRLTCSIRNYRCTVEEGAGSGRPAGGAPGFGGRFFGGGTEIDSPDGKKTAFVRDYDLWVRDKATGDETRLTTDGEEDYGYATNNAGWTKSDRPVLLWSPDSKKIATFRHDGRGVGMMYLVSTKSGHPDLQAWKYPLPGDSLIFRIERIVAHVDEPRVVRLQMPADDHRSTITDHIVDGGQWADIEWSTDSARLVFVSTSRDHRTEILRVADPETGAVRDVLTEVEDTFYESGFNEINNRLLDATDEYLWYSQRDDWGHLYLYDLATGALKNRITSGAWKVLAIRHIDEKARRIWFMGAGREPGDPYFQYLYSVKFDGSDLKLLTPDSLNHTITFSPSMRYFIDSASSPSIAPTITLRDAQSGALLSTLETADISALVAAGWKAPIPFVTKARDGETDIYGLMYTPTTLDPSKKYPVLNYLYPGPQTGSVGGRSFTPTRSDKQAVSELGFVVVELDALGTPMRSHSFHSFYYGNMGDNGLPDNIAGIRQLAARNPYMDLDRVGIWGHSGGGFASTAGILRYPDFYKVAVSGAGNHDNATYEDDWGEKWHGLLVRNEDGTTTYDNQANHLLAGNLKGKLLLAHGSMDSNVPPNNTLLVAEALMNAGKDFDMLIFPNSGHGFRQGNYWTRRRWDYFVRNLLGVEPPKEYVIGGGGR